MKTPDYLYSRCSRRHSAMRRRLAVKLYQLQLKSFT